MEDQESYLNEEEVNQGLNKAGNAVTQFGQGMYGGVKSGIKDFKDIKNHGLQSSNKELDDTKKEPEIPEPKNQNPSSTGTPNQLPGSDNSNNPLDKNKDEKGTKKDDDKKEKSKKDDGKKDKKQSLKEKINEKNPLNKLKKKIDEKNPLNKLNKKLEEKLNPAKLLLKKVKLYGGLILLGCSLILILIIALVGGTAIHTTLHNITEDFVYSTGEITTEENAQVVRTFGWYLKETGEYEVTKVKKTVYSNYDTPEGTVSIPHETEVEEKAPIYEAIFNNGIDVKITEGTKIRSSQPGTITTVNNDYIEINHNLNEENRYNNKEYITKYYNYGTLFKDTKENYLVVKETTLSLAGKDVMHFEITEDGKYIDPNLMFGYEAAGEICEDEDAIKTTRGTASNEDIKKLLDNKCVSKTKYIGRKAAKQLAYNNSYFGTPEGEYTSLVCGSSNISAKGPGTAQCAAGVYRYFNSFLPKLDKAAWMKFDRIRGNAVDYWIRNNSLGKDGFKADQTPTPGSVWVSSYSSATCGTSACGHVMAVISVAGDNVNVFECNHYGNEMCWYHTYTKSYLSNYRGFLGYIHILGEC